MVTVSSSVDDIIWRDVTVEEDISRRYDCDYAAAYMRFSTRFTSRYWEIFTVGVNAGAPKVKADLVGFQPWFKMLLYIHLNNKIVILKALEV